jgi:hypothetical protein
MNFYMKVAIQHVLSFLPGGRSAYLWILDHIAKTTQPMPSVIKQKLDVGLQYLDKLGGREILRSGTHLDIGAGWHLTIPLLYYQLGCDKQVLTDIQSAATAELVFPVVDYFQKYPPIGCVRTLPPTNGHTLSSYLKILGIVYDPTVSTRLPVADGSVTLVTSTQTFLYPPRPIVSSLFEEAARVLAPGGYFVATIHLYDLYSLADRSLSRFNFLRYSQHAWERYFNCAMMNYNRMRASDFRQLLDGLPFDTVFWDVTKPTETDYKDLDRIKVHPEFSGYSRDDLASSHLLFAMRRRY